MEAPGAQPQRLDADHLGRSHLPQRRDRVSTGDLELWAVDRKKGEPMWKRPLGGGNIKLQKQNMSTPSPVTDGTTVWVMTGTGILKAFDFKGTELWTRDVQKDYGQFGLNWGYASSPLFTRDRCTSRSCTG